MKNGLRSCWPLTAATTLCASMAAAAEICDVMSNDSVQTIAQSANVARLEGFEAPELAAAKIIDELANSCSAEAPDAGEEFCRANAVRRIADLATREIRNRGYSERNGFSTMLLFAAKTCLDTISEKYAGLDNNSALVEKIAATTAEATRREIAADLHTIAAVTVVQQVEAHLNQVLTTDDVPESRAWKYRCTNMILGGEEPREDCMRLPLVDAPNALSSKMNAALSSALDAEGSDLSDRLEALSRRSDTSLVHCNGLFDDAPKYLMQRNNRDLREQLSEICVLLQNNNLISGAEAEPYENWNFLVEYLDGPQPLSTNLRALAFIASRGGAVERARSSAISAQNEASSALKEAVCAQKASFKENVVLLNALSAEALDAWEEFSSTVMCP